MSIGARPAARDTSTCRRAYLSEMVISGIALRLVMIFSRGASTSALPETTSRWSWLWQLQSSTMCRLRANFCPTVTVTVIVSPIATGRAKWSDDSTITVPGPGNCVPSMVDSSEAHHMPCAMKSWKTPLWLNSALASAGFMSPDISANSLTSSGRKVRTSDELSPTLISS
jgi:hypothetical protein